MHSTILQKMHARSCEYRPPGPLARWWSCCHPAAAATWAAAAITLYRRRALLLLALLRLLLGVLCCCRHALGLGLGLTLVLAVLILILLVILCSRRRVLERRTSARRAGSVRCGRLSRQLSMHPGRRASANSRHVPATDWAVAAAAHRNDSPHHARAHTSRHAVRTQAWSVG